MNLLVDKNFNIFNMEGVTIAKLKFNYNKEEFYIDLLDDIMYSSETHRDLQNILKEWNGM